MNYELSLIASCNVGGHGDTLRLLPVRRVRSEICHSAAHCLDGHGPVCDAQIDGSAHGGVQVRVAAAQRSEICLKHSSISFSQENICTAAPVCQTPFIGKHETGMACVFSQWSATRLSSLIALLGSGWSNSVAICCLPPSPSDHRLRNGWPARLARKYPFENHFDQQVLI